MTTETAYIDDIWGMGLVQWRQFRMGIRVNVTAMDTSMTSTERTRPVPSALSRTTPWAVAGINWNIKIMVLKFLGPDGGYTLRCYSGFQLRGQQGARKVISCSWGGGGYNQALKDAIEAAHAHRVVRRGNSGDNTDINPHYPSSYDSDNIISVAAMMQNDTPCNYSGWWSTCWGPTSVDLYAPGGYILSTIPRILRQQSLVRHTISSTARPWQHLMYQERQP